MRDLFIYFLAQLVAMKLELKRVQEKAARAASTEDTVERPSKIGNLQADMSLANDDMAYVQFRVSSLSFLLSIVTNYMYYRLSLDAMQLQQDLIIRRFGRVKMCIKLHALLGW